MPGGQVRWSEEVARTEKLKKATQTRERIADRWNTLKSTNGKRVTGLFGTDPRDHKP